MAVHVWNVDIADTTIREADLEYPGEELLDCFIREAVDPDRAARYFLQQCSLGLPAFIKDWVEVILAFAPQHVLEVREEYTVKTIARRDKAECCISGLGDSIIDRLIVVRILTNAPKRLNSSLHEMLDAFLSPSLKNVALTAETGKFPQNLWLLRKSAAEAFQQGYFRVRLQGDTDNYHVNVNRSGGPTRPWIIELAPAHRNGSFTNRTVPGTAIPARSALKILDHFSRPIRWAHIHEEVTQKTDEPVTLASPRSRFPTASCAITLSVLWSWVPAALRVATYHGLSSLGKCLYEPSCSLSVQQLPFGLYLKKRSLSNYGVLENERRALELARRHTQAVVPRPVDLVTSGKNSYLLTSAVPGMHLELCIDTMTNAEIADFVRDLREWLVQLRSIPPTVRLEPRGDITNAVGKACIDDRISAGAEYDGARGKFFGPFRDEDDFNNFLYCRAVPDVVHRGGHEIVLAHGDLDMRNIMVENGKLSGIVDWENSGWYPEYWDYTKAHFATKRHRRWKRVIDAIFAELGDYQGDLETEKKLWGNYV